MRRIQPELWVMVNKSGRHIRVTGQFFADTLYVTICYWVADTVGDVREQSNQV